MIAQKARRSEGVTLIREQLNRGQGFETAVESIKKLINDDQLKEASELIAIMESKNVLIDEVTELNRLYWEKNTLFRRFTGLFIK